MRILLAPMRSMRRPRRAESLQRDEGTFRAPFPALCACALALVLSRALAFTSMESPLSLAAAGRSPFDALPPVLLRNIMLAFPSMRARSALLCAAAGATSCRTPRCGKCWT